MPNYTEAELDRIVKSTGNSSRITELCLIEDIREARTSLIQAEAKCNAVLRAFNKYASPNMARELVAVLEGIE
jgi:hypothetical protein